MSTVAKKTDPALWDKIKTEVTAGDKGGRPGQWSARKAQLASTEYRRQGGGYAGGKTDNHLQQWTDENWNTESGGRSRDTGERYLPEAARAHLSDAEYRRTTAKKRDDTRAGRQFSAQPPDIARKTASDRDRLDDLSVGELRKRAAAHDVAGRSRMTKAALIRALG